MKAFCLSSPQPLPHAPPPVHRNALSRCWFLSTHERPTLRRRQCSGTATRAAASHHAHCGAVSSPRRHRSRNHHRRRHRVLLACSCWPTSRCAGRCSCPSSPCSCSSGSYADKCLCFWRRSPSVLPPLSPVCPPQRDSPSARHSVIAISYCAVCMPFPHDREQLSFVVYYSPEFSRYSRTQYLTRDGIGVELIRQVCMDGEGVVGEGGGSQPRTSATRRRAREAQQLRRDGAGIRGSGQGCRESRQGWSTESSRRTRRHLCRLTATTPDAAQPPRVCAESALVYAERRASCPGKC